MRCARCDKLTIPQSTGYTPEGGLVFGWCMACMEETNCKDVVVAESATRRRRQPVRRATESMDDRRRVVGATALVIALWGLALLLVGLRLRATHDPKTATGLGNGTPALLIGGGSTTASVGLALWAITSGRILLRSRGALKGVQAGAFLVAMGALGTGIMMRRSRSDLWVMGVTSAALAISVWARWVETRRYVVGKKG